MQTAIDISTSGSGLASGVFSGSLDVGLDDIGVSVNRLPATLPVVKLDVAVSSLPKIFTDSNLTSASTVALDLKVAVTDLPKIKLEFGFTPMRMHFPTHYQMCFSLFGKEVFKFALCGESMIACEHYHPHETEKCG